MPNHRVIITPLDKPSGLLEVHIQTPDDHFVGIMSLRAFRTEVQRYQDYCKRNKLILTLNYTDNLELPKPNEELKSI